MSPHEAERIARDLLHEHGLDAQGWRFGWDNGRRRMGCTHWAAKRITLSRHYVALNDAPLIHLVMLHEIAHAFAGAAAKHGPAWRREAIRLGVPPRACTNAPVSPEKRWEAYCDRCDRVVARRHRRTNHAKHNRCGALVEWRETA